MVFIERTIRLLKNPDIIHYHTLGEYGGRIRIPGPVPSDSNIHNEEEWFVKGVVSANFSFGSSIIEYIVNQEFHPAVIPIKTEDIEASRKITS
jgi:hypothetical protein